MLYSARREFIDVTDDHHSEADSGRMSENVSPAQRSTSVLDTADNRISRALMEQGVCPTPSNTTHYRGLDCIPFSVDRGTSRIGTLDQGTVHHWSV